MSDSDPCTCAECNRAGVRRPAVAPLGQTLHGRELEDYWLAREEFGRALLKVKNPALAAAAKTLTGEK